MNSTKAEAYLRITHNNAVVRKILDAGGTAEDCVIGLDEYCKLLLDRLNTLESIRPRKIRLGERVFVWHCPNDLIPEEGNSVQGGLESDGASYSPKL